MEFSSFSSFEDFEVLQRSRMNMDESSWLGQEGTVEY
jgi:hypothetical protein